RLARRPLKPFNAPFRIEKQKALGLAMMEAIGFDFEHGRLDISHHPFCGGVPTDVRMTTRYVTGEFLSSLMGILHETGHGLYEQNLPEKWSSWAVGKARGMAIHESQSLFVEKQIARSAEFWEWALPHVREHLGEEALAGWDLEDVLALDALEQAIWDRLGRGAKPLIHHSDAGGQYLSIRYTERLAEAGIEPSVGSVGDSYDNSMAESVIGLYKTELIRNRGPWRNLDTVEFATLEWVDWWNNRRILEPIGNIPPAEKEANYYHQNT